VRNGALMSCARELPPPVLERLLGFSPGTAEQWASPTASGLVAVRPVTASWEGQITPSNGYLCGSKSGSIHTVRKRPSTTITGTAFPVGRFRPHRRRAMTLPDELDTDGGHGAARTPAP